MAEPSLLTVIALRITEEIKYNKITQPLLSSPLLSKITDQADQWPVATSLNLHLHQRPVIKAEVDQTITSQQYHQDQVPGPTKEYWSRWSRRGEGVGTCVVKHHQIFCKNCPYHSILSIILRTISESQLLLISFRTAIFQSMNSNLFNKIFQV